MVIIAIVIKFILIIGGACACTMLFRNEMVCSARCKLIDMAAEYNREKIYANSNIRIDLLPHVSYVEMCFDFSCWTKKGFINKYWPNMLENRYENQI